MKTIFDTDNDLGHARRTATQAREALEKAEAAHRAKITECLTCNDAAQRRAAHNVAAWWGIKIPEGVTAELPVPTDKQLRAKKRKAVK